MDDVLTFDQMIDDPDANGLCSYCNIVPFILTPNGPLMCEGSYCGDAYARYLEDTFEDPCFTCQHKALPITSQTQECEECAKYEKWKPKGGAK